MEECSKRDLSAGFFRRIFIVLCEWGGGAGVITEMYQPILSNMFYCIM